MGGRGEETVPLVLGSNCLRHGETQTSDRCHQCHRMNRVSAHCPDTGLSWRAKWLGDVDSNHGMQIQSLLSYR